MRMRWICKRGEFLTGRTDALPLPGSSQCPNGLVSSRPLWQLAISCSWSIHLAWHTILGSSDVFSFAVSSFSLLSLLDQTVQIALQSFNDMKWKLDSRMLLNFARFETYGTIACFDFNMLWYFRGWAICSEDCKDVAQGNNLLVKKLDCTIDAAPERKVLLAGLQI